MTEVIRPKFDVVRGWAGGGSLGSAYDKTFNTVVDGSGVATKLKQGTFVTLHSSGGCTPVTVGTAVNAPIWCLVEGNDPLDSYSGDYLNKAVGIKGSYEVLLSTTMFTAGSYTPGAGVSVVAGKVQVADASHVAVGYVTEVDVAGGTIKAAFSL